MIVLKEWQTKSGHKALIVKGTSPYLSCLCGYVGVTKESNFFGVDYNKLDFDVHGGATFSAYRDDKTDLWWFGFDCAHAGDTLEKCDLDFCVNQCENLSKQIKEAKSLP